MFCFSPRLVLVAAEAQTDCDSFFEPQAQVSMQMLGMIVGITGGVILCCAILGIAAVRHIQPLGCCHR